MKPTGLLAQPTVHVAQNALCSQPAACTERGLLSTQDLLARGMTFSPSPRFGTLFGGRRDLTFGIYGRADAARDLLQEKWSGVPLQMIFMGRLVSLTHPSCCVSPFDRELLVLSARRLQY